MRIIFKYPLVGEQLESDGRFKIIVNMPIDPKPIRVVILERSGLKAVVTLWAEIETTNDLEDHTFWLIGTGREVPKDCNYIGTIENGPFVWHSYGPEEIKQ